MFTAALFTIAKIWKQPKCPSIDEWIKNMQYTYTMKYYSANRKLKGNFKNLKTERVKEEKYKEKNS